MQPPAKNTLQRHYQCSGITWNIGCHSADFTTRHQGVCLRSRVGPVNSIVLLYGIAFFQQPAAGSENFYQYAGYPEIIYRANRDCVSNHTTVRTGADFTYDRRRHEICSRPAKQVLPGLAGSDIGIFDTLICAFHYCRGIFCSQQKVLLYFQLSSSVRPRSFFRGFRNYSFSLPLAKYEFFTEGSSELSCCDTII